MCVCGGSRDKEFFKSLVPLGNCRLLDQFGRSTDMKLVWEELHEVKLRK